MSDAFFKKIVAAVPLLADLDKQEMEEILGISRLINVPADSVIINEGDEASSMYIVVHGKVEIFRDGGDTRHSLALLGPGQVFGEMALIDRSPRSASARTVNKAVLYQMDVESFNQLRDQFNPAAFKILVKIAPFICQRLRRVNEQISAVISETLRASDEEKRNPLMSLKEKGL